jgi:hypothetical protein
MHRAGHYDVALGRMSGLCPDHIRQAYMLVHAKQVVPCAIPVLSLGFLVLQCSCSLTLCTKYHACHTVSTFECQSTHCGNIHVFWRPEVVCIVSSPLLAIVTPVVQVLCRDNFWYWETVVLVQTLGLVAAQIFASSLDGSFQLTIMLVILVAGALALAQCHPFEQEGPQIVQVCTVMVRLVPYTFVHLAKINSYQADP